MHITARQLLTKTLTKKQTQPQDLLQYFNMSNEACMVSSIVRVVSQMCGGGVCVCVCVCVCVRVSETEGERVH